MDSTDRLDEKARFDPVHGTRIDEEQRGKNLVSYGFKHRETFYFVRMRLRVSKDLESEEKKLEVDTNLPFSKYNYWGYNYSDVGGKSLFSFLDELQDWCSKPQFHATHGLRLRANRIDLLSFRKVNVFFEDLKVEIGSEAEKYIKENLGVRDIRMEIFNRIELQRRATPEEERAGERYVRLLEQLALLKYQVDGSPSRYYQHGDFRAEARKLLTLKKKEFNLVATRIQRELNALCNKYSWLDKHEVDLYRIEVKPSMEQWLESRGNYGDQTVEDELKEAWENDEYEDDYDNFEEFVEEQYNNFLECHDFDE